MKVSSNLLRSISVSIRGKLFICVLVVIAGCSYCYISNPYIRYISIIAWIFAVELMILLWGNFFLTSIFESIKNVFSFRKKVQWVDLAEIRNLADCMGVKIPKGNAFGIKDGLNNAFTIGATGKIIFGAILLNKLEQGERLSLAAHELGHLRNNHQLRLSLWSTIMMMFTYMSLSFTNAPSIVKNVICVAIFFISFTVMSWKNESEADMEAAKFIGIDNTISLLKKILPEDQWNKESETHPSINSRVARLKRF